MSATGRGVERQEDDFYVTPAWCVHALLAKLDLPGGSWLEPGAGNGAIVRAVAAMRPEIVFTAIEKRNEVLVGEQVPCGWWTGDFLAPNAELLAALQQRFDVVIGNPAYKFARQFIEQGLQFSNIVAYLLRLDFLGSRKRVAFWREHPADVYVLPDRPSFVLSVKCKTCGWRVVLPLDVPRPSRCETPGCASKLQISTTDANEYGWFVWGMGGGKISHLDPKPADGVIPSPYRRVDLSRCRDCGEFLTHGHECKQVDVVINENGDDVLVESIPSDLTVGAFYALADGRFVVFEGVASRYSFFAGTRDGATAKLRLETASVQAWPAAGSAIECSACKWAIAAEAAGDCCPFCGAR